MTLNGTLLATALSASLAMFCGATAASATTKPASKTPAKSTTHVMSDDDFAKAAAEGGMAEVKFGQLAEEKGNAEVVKDFGKRMVTDHTRIGDELKTTATADKLTLPMELSAHDQAVYDHLSKLSGSAFDRAYAHDMVRDHEVDIAAFKTEVKDGKNAGLKTFASNALPTLEEHLKLARTMQHDVYPKKAASTTKKQG